MPIDMPSQSNELLAIQSRAIACRQGAGAGINPRAMRTRMGSGRWQRLQWGVYAVHSGEPARETMLWAALLRAGPGAVLSHQTAAVERPHGLPAARRQARIRQRTGNRYLDNLYEEYGFARNSMGPLHIPPMSSGAINAGTTPTRSKASSRSGSASPTWAIIDARPQPPLPRCCACVAGQELPTHAPAQAAASQGQLHDHGQFRSL
jgi:hypothetical protein